ncbi:MAG: TAXI family TRAP transporter solute-binding subunit, partial [Syntrophorhabdus sp.]
KTRNIHRRDFLKLTGIGAVTLFLGQARDVFALSKSRITIATGTMGGIYFVIGGGIARLLTKYTSAESVAEITTGSLENCELVAAKRSHLGLTTADTAYDAFRGAGRFQGSPVPLRILAALYPNLTHIICLDKKKIATIADLKGKLVSVGSKGSATEAIAARILSAANLDHGSDLKKLNMGASESAAALKDGYIDAYIWSGGIPAASIRELAEQPGLRITVIDHANLVPVMNRKYGPIYYKSTIPVETYKGLADDVVVSTVANLLVCHKDMEEQTAYTVLKVIFEHLKELSSVHKEANRIDLKAGASLNLIPYHPGARKFFSEHGLTVPV